MKWLIILVLVGAVYLFVYCLFAINKNEMPDIKDVTEDL